MFKERGERRNSTKDTSIREKKDMNENAPKIG
jgi:hypothetical protein